jgi:DNA-binding MarR family transcriptional regulator
MEDVKVIRGFGILYRTFLSYISKSLSSKDLSFSDSVFLVNIGDNEGTNQEEIANSLAIDKAAIARSVKDMEKKGYVRTERSKVDKRAKELYLSNSGKELYQYMQSLNQEWINHVMGDLDPDDIKDFIRTIDHISNRAKTFNKF